MKEMQNTFPPEIFLNTGLDSKESEGVKFSELSEVTWCANKISEADVSYVRKDLSIEMAIAFGAFIGDNDYEIDWKGCWFGLPQNASSTEELFQIFLEQQYHD